jgi:pimeloyl-ACP methyl ester carboxylesterase
MNGRLLIIHGQKDKLIPINHAEELEKVPLSVIQAYNNATKHKQPAQLIKVPSMSHNNIIWEEQVFIPTRKFIGEAKMSDVKVGRPSNHIIEELKKCPLISA